MPCRADLAWGKGNRSLITFSLSPQGWMPSSKRAIEASDQSRGRAQASPAILGSPDSKSFSLDQPTQAQVPGREGEQAKNQTPSRLKHSNMLVLTCYTHILHVPGLPYADICTTTHFPVCTGTCSHTHTCVHTHCTFMQCKTCPHPHSTHQVCPHIHACSWAPGAPLALRGKMGNEVRENRKSYLLASL